MYKEKLEQWLKSTVISEEIKSELREITDEKELEDRFYKELEFGTGGLRGVIGAGSNRMNVYTVSKATQGFANYLNDKFELPSIAIAYDSRNMSKEFAKATALTFCANDIKVYLFESLRPTPMLSYSVRKLNCKGGIVITASHNPKQYNGYKAYDEFGGQVTDEKADLIINAVNNVKKYEEIKTIDENKAIEKGLLNYLGEEIDKEYTDYLKSLTIRKSLVDNKAKDLKIIYTPIHGTGNIPVRRVLGELGYENLKVVKEQELPDGNFTTAPYPNPEDPKVFELALNMTKEFEPDIIFGTDPDADRIGVIVKDKEGNYRILTGNETGLLLTEYILKSLKEESKLPQNGVVIKTIVTTEGVRSIAEDYNVELMDVLTGFKYIGEKIQQFEINKDKKYIFGFEESYGYLAGDYVRDKDAVVAAMLICEMTLYYKEKGLSLYDGLIQLYNKYGYYKESLKSVVLEGKEGQEKIGRCLDNLRKSNLNSISDVAIEKILDYKLSIEKNLSNNTDNAIELPKSNVLKYILEDESYFVVRPSGTEPKMKVYLSVKGKDLDDGENKLKNFEDSVMKIINNNLV